MSQVDKMSDYMPFTLLRLLQPVSYQHQRMVNQLNAASDMIPRKVSKLSLEIGKALSCLVLITPKTYNLQFSVSVTVLHVMCLYAWFACLTASFGVPEAIHAMLVTTVITNWQQQPLSDMFIAQAVTLTHAL